VQISKRVKENYLGDKIVVYTIGCPKCKILEKKLDDAGINYSKIEDEKLMIAKEIESVPVLEVNGETMDFAKAIKWVNWSANDEHKY